MENTFRSVYTITVIVGKSVNMGCVILFGKNRSNVDSFLLMNDDLIGGGRELSHRRIPIRGC
jgi:hypothetical protein